LARLNGFDVREADGHVWQETGRLRMENEASLGRAAELAGLPLGQMITILTEFGVESRLEKDDSTVSVRISPCVLRLCE